jgi:hypothetical protein
VVCPSQDWEIDGLCESPHDNPPKWACMLTAYFDESFESEDGFTVLAGFVGKKKQWKNCAEAWRDALPPERPHLHMKDFRWKVGKDKNKDLLEKMAKVPHEAGLQPVFGAVRVSDYIHLVEHYQEKKLTDGYLVSIFAALTPLLLELPKGERVEVLFEEQRKYAEVREWALGVISRTHSRVDGKRRLVKWSSVPKSSLLEPCDYLAYALMQSFVNPDSTRSRLCSPILNMGKKRIGGRASKDQVGMLLRFKKTSASV